MSIRVIQPGVLTTVQDLGRFGFQQYGVPVSGAMDPRSLKLANLLLGNDPGEAALEITVTGPQLIFGEANYAVLTGGDLGAELDGNKCILDKRQSSYCRRVPSGGLPGNVF